MSVTGSIHFLLRTLETLLEGRVPQGGGGCDICGMLKQRVAEYSKYPLLKLSLANKHKEKAATVLYTIKILEDIQDLIN